MTEDFHWTFSDLRVNGIFTQLGVGKNAQDYRKNGLCENKLVHF